MKMRMVAADKLGIAQRTLNSNQQLKMIPD